MSLTFSPSMTTEPNSESTTDDLQISFDAPTTLAHVGVSTDLSSAPHHTTGSPSSSEAVGVTDKPDVTDADWHMYLVYAAVGAAVLVAVIVVICIIRRKPAPNSKTPPINTPEAPAPHVPARKTDRRNVASEHMYINLEKNRSQAARQTNSSITSAQTAGVQEDVQHRDSPVEAAPTVLPRKSYESITRHKGMANWIETLDTSLTEHHLEGLAVYSLDHTAYVYSPDFRIPAEDIDLMSKILDSAHEESPVYSNAYVNMRGSKYGIVSSEYSTEHMKCTGPLGEDDRILWVVRSATYVVVGLCALESDRACLDVVSHYIDFIKDLEKNENQLQSAATRGSDETQSVIRKSDINALRDHAPSIYANRAELAVNT